MTLKGGLQVRGIDIFCKNSNFLFILTQIDCGSVVHIAFHNYKKYGQSFGTLLKKSEIMAHPVLKGLVLICLRVNSSDHSGKTSILFPCMAIDITS